MISIIYSLTNYLQRYNLLKSQQINLYLATYPSLK